jgi:hypothetical protein
MTTAIRVICTIGFGKPDCNSIYTGSFDSNHPVLNIKPTKLLLLNKLLQLCL